VSDYLKIDTKPEQPVTIKEYADDQDTKDLEQVQGIPENVGVGSL
jgi:hypothetical protein